MKSSTIRRSNLSKEKMAVLEALSKYRQDSYDYSPNVYVRQNKEKELDLLWQNFKLSTKGDKSPGVYLVTGFIAGATAMLVLTTLISFSAREIDAKTEAPQTAKVKKEAISFIPSNNKNQDFSSDTASEIYTVQSGDTMEAILIRFYGSYSKEKEKIVLKMNNMSNPNRLSIGQKLTMPMN